MACKKKMGPRSRKDNERLARVACKEMGQKPRSHDLGIADRISPLARRRRLGCFQPWALRPVITGHRHTLLAFAQQQ